MRPTGSFSLVQQTPFSILHTKYRKSSNCRSNRKSIPPSRPELRKFVGIIGLVTSNCGYFLVLLSSAGSDVKAAACRNGNVDITARSEDIFTVCVSSLNENSLVIWLCRGSQRSDPDERIILVMLCSRVSSSSLIFEDQRPQSASDESPNIRASVFARTPTLSIWDFGE
jgi:hypothetical protein